MVLAIVPVKGRDGKSRLDGFLSAAERAHLIEAMLADVLAACDGARAVTRTLVVTPDPDVVPDRVDVLVDPGLEHADAIARALADAGDASGVLVVMADCPLARAESLDRLAGAARPVALAPAHDGGVNAVALASREAVEPAFGLPDAAAITAERARAAAIEPAVLDDPALAFDVDEPPDVWRLRESHERTRAGQAVAAIVPATARVR